MEITNPERIASMGNERWDVVVAGAGNAALCAALSAREEGAEVLVLEAAPRHERGGNSYFVGGLVRFPYGGIDDVRALIPDLTDDEVERVDVGSYGEEEFFEDLARVTDYEADPELISVLVSEAYPTMKWLAGKGLRFSLALGRQAFESGDVFKFWGNAPVEYAGGGPGLVDGLCEIAEEEGIEIRYGTRARALIVSDEGRVEGLVVRSEGAESRIRAGAVVLATGGFEANPAMRAKYLGPNWDVAKVRGTAHNTGDGLTMAMEAGARPYGNFSGCHAVAWDANAPPTGDRKVGDGYQKHSYPLGIVVNREGKRFVDEGADFRNYTYAKYGKEILNQPGRVAFQIFDSQVSHLLRDEYTIREVTRAQSDSLEEVATELGIDPEGLAGTVEAFNASVTDDEFRPAVLDGKRTVGIDPPKSNWALPLEKPPYTGYAVTCGITFTFGGLKVDTDARVLDLDDHPIAGLAAAGELVGGLYYHNYAGGTGLSSGAVFGRIAGRTAGRFATG